MERERCMAIAASTKKQCKKPAKRDGLCHVHAPKERLDPVTKEEKQVPEKPFRPVPSLKLAAPPKTLPAEKGKKKDAVKLELLLSSLGLPAPHANLDQSHRSALRTLLLKAPILHPRGGHIYVYYFASDHAAGRSYWKVGRTSRPVEKRMKEWKKIHGQDVVLAHSFDVSDDVRAERMIHIYLDYCRIYRWAYADARTGVPRYHSTWKKDGRVIQDGQQFPDQNRSRRDLVAMHKHVEWFVASEEELMAVVDPVIRMYGL